MLKGINLKKKERKVNINPQEKWQRLIEKIKTAPDTYESTADVDKWNIEFTVGEHYGSKTFEQIEVLHDKLISAGSSITKLKLLNFAERGQLYDFLKIRTLGLEPGAPFVMN